MDSKKLVEVLLFSSPEPLTQGKLNQILFDGENIDMKLVVEVLNADYLKENKGLEIEKIGGGYQILSHPEYHLYIQRLFNKAKKGTIGYSYICKVCYKISRCDVIIAKYGTKEYVCQEFHKQKKLNKKNDLSDEKVWELYNKPCHYCGVFDLKKGYLESSSKEISGEISNTFTRHCEKY